MRFFSAAGMQSVDRQAIASGVSGRSLMGLASRKLAGELIFFSEECPRPVMVLCGPGNNGGDGFGLARLLHLRGWPVRIGLCVPKEKISGDALLFLQMAEAERVPCTPLLEPADWENAELSLLPGAWLVDALLGTGSREAPRGHLARAVEFLNRHRPAHRIWSVDLPSGLDPDRGVPFEETLCVHADATLTLGGPKLGFRQDASAQWTGSVSVLDLDFPSGLLEAHAAPDSPHCLSDREAAALFPTAHHDAHKGSRGHLLLVGGSPGMTGAISLSAWAALRSGCGLVSVLTPHSCAEVVDAAVPEAMVLHGKQSRFGSLSNQGIYFSNFHAVGVGPGMRLNPESMEFVVRLLSECRLPLVLDADALNAYAQLDPDAQHTRSPLWMTPHPGEMARLLRVTTQQVLKDREQAATWAARQFNARTLVKGARSRMADPAGNIRINFSGNAGMATAGCGDVLTGLLSGLLAQGVAADRVLSLAVYLHGRAGDLAAVRKGQSGLLAGDVVDAIPAVLKHLQGR